MLDQLQVNQLDLYEIKDNDTITTVQNVHVTAEHLYDTTYSMKNIKKLTVSRFERQIDELNFISFDQLNIKQDSIYIDTFRILDQYTKEDYIHHIDFEKDHIDFMVNGIQLKDVDFTASRKKLDRISIDEITIDTSRLKVYRDKTIKDDQRIKPTYGQMLQNLGFELDINELNINDSKLFYSSKRENYKLGEFMFDR